MNQRIQELLNKTIKGEMYVKPVKTEYDRMDLLLSPIERQAKRTYEFILNQEPIITEFSALTGLLKFDGSVEGDLFNRTLGHKNSIELFKAFYNKPVENLVTLEWQHSTADFGTVVRGGIKGFLEKIENSKQHRTEKEDLEFLNGLETVGNAIVGWANKCSKRAMEAAENISVAEYKSYLIRLSKALLKVPYNPAESFYEAVLSVYICFSFVPDSIGLIDRYLYPFYKKDIESGIITREEAGELLQELFLMLQARIPITSDRFTRGGESHFAIGGYLPNGEDGFNDLSRLIVEALMDLPTYIPQISLRWNEKTPHEVFEFMMEAERKDPNKRIAFVNDEPRIKALTNNAGIPYEVAVNYTMVGCNELALPGGMYYGCAQNNILHSVERTFFERKADVLKSKTFEEFYSVYEQELNKDLERMLWYEEKFSLVHARDVNLVSSFFLNGCIENAKSVTKGGCSYACAGLDFIGVTNVIDSITVVKQFVYEQKNFTMEQLVLALENNWQGYEDMRNFILKKGDFFGNDAEISNLAGVMFSNSVYEFLKNKKSVFGYNFLVGNLIGYNEHHKFFGELTRATPDGRYDYTPMKYGIGQSDGYDREGLTALLNSIARYDKHAIMAGSTVTNVNIDKQLIDNDESFKLVIRLFETYFKNGGIHFQLNYISQEDLINAKNNPEKYKTLRVRVSGFSDYFVILNDALQDEIILRTVQK